MRLLTALHVCVWSRLLEEEAEKRAELEVIHLHQQRAISETEAEKQELEKERLAKESALQAAMKQLEELEQERQGALAQYQVSQQPRGKRFHIFRTLAVSFQTKTLPLNFCKLEWIQMIPMVILENLHL